MSIFGVELTRNEVADRIGISRLKFQTLVKEGRGPAYRLDGRTMLFNQDMVDEWATKYRADVYKAAAAHQNEKTGKTGRTGRKTRAVTADTSELLA